MTLMASRDVVLVEEWESRADLEDHIASEKYRISLSLMKLSVKLPEIKLNTVLHAESIELVEAVRA
jgi:quinol monooxygenase YgiN